MADYTVSGITPAQTGGEWANGDSWFLIDKSGEFSVDKDLLATIYVVGGGAHGGNSCDVVGLVGSHAAATVGYSGGDGGDGGCVSTFYNVSIPTGSICMTNIGAPGTKISSDSVNKEIYSCATTVTTMTLNEYKQALLQKQWKRYKKYGIMYEEGVNGNGRRFEKYDGEQFEYKRTLVCRRSGISQ